METFSELLALCEFPSQRPVTRSFDVFFHLCLNEWLSKQLEAGDLRCHRDHYDIIVMAEAKLCDEYNIVQWHDDWILQKHECQLWF